MNLSELGMTDKKTDRLLVPENQVIVVLDTASARNLAYPEQPPQWVDTFAKMSVQGYSFSLADGTLAELLAQRRRDALTAEEYHRICQRLERFLNPQLPVLLGKRDLMGMLQVNNHPWSEDECRQMSLSGWSRLKRYEENSDEQQSPEWVLQEERDDWIEFFSGWQQIIDEINAENPSSPLDLEAMSAGMLEGMASAQDTWSSLVPSMSVRLHLQSRYLCRQFIRMQKAEDAYNPTSKKKRNDGIDADLYRFLQLPALVVTEDRGFLTGLGDIDSFQKHWFFKAEALAEKWEQGQKPAPIWP